MKVFKIFIGIIIFFYSCFTKKENHKCQTSLFTLDTIYKDKFIKCDSLERSFKHKKIGKLYYQELDEGNGLKYYYSDGKCIVDSLNEEENAMSIKFVDSIITDNGQIFVFETFNRCGSGIHCEYYRFIKIDGSKMQSTELIKNYKEEIIDNNKLILNKREFKIDFSNMIIKVKCNSSESSIQYNGSIPFNFDKNLKIKLDSMKVIQKNGNPMWRKMKSDEVFRNCFNI